jgi:hypothetical protein
MKKFLLLLPVFLVVTIVTAFARSTTNVNPRAEQEFKKYFANVENVKWSKEEGGYLQASFTWANHRTLAYFNSNGELVGSIRGISFSQLPLVVLRSVERSYKEAIILETSEITNDEGTQYKLIIEDDKKKYAIRLNSFGDVLKKEKVK